MRAAYSHRLVAPALAALSLALAPAGAQALPPNTPDQDAFVTNGAVRAIKPAGDVTYIGGDFTELRARTGPGARFTTSTGRRIAPVAAVEGGDVYTSAPDGAGGYFIGGNFTHVGGLLRNRIAHILPNGNVDPAFNANITGTSVEALAVANGVVFVGGDFTNIGGRARSNIAKLSATTGNAFSGWDANANHPVKAIAVSGGAVYAGGEFFGADSIGGRERDHIAKLSATTGNAFSAFDPDAGGVVTPTVDVLVVSGPAVYVAGNFAMIGGEARDYVAKLSATSGNAFTGFNAGANNGVYSLATDGSVLYAGGSFTQLGGQPRNHIAKLSTTTGNAFSAWDPNSDNEVTALAVSDGAVYAGGLFANIGGRPRNHVAKLSADSGNAFSSWDANTDGDLETLALSGSSLFAGGGFEDVNAITRNNIAALDSTGVPTSWNPNADAIVHDIEVSATGDVVYPVGAFTNIGGRSRTAIAKLSATSGNAFSGFDPDPSGIARVAVLRGSALYVGGDFSQGGDGTTANDDLAKYSAETGNVFTGFAPNPMLAAVNVTIPGLAVGDDGAVYAGGNFTSIGGFARNRIAKLSGTTGNAFSAWNPGANAPVGALEVSGSALYVGGDFNGADSIGGEDRNYIAKLSTTSGNVFTGFNPNADGSVFAFSVDDTAVYAGGLFFNIGGVARNRLAALSPTSGLSFASFAPSANGVFVSDVESTSSKLYVGGDFTEISERPRQGYAQFSQP